MTTCLTGFEDQSSTLLSSSRFCLYNQRTLFNPQSPIIPPLLLPLKKARPNKYSQHLVERSPIILSSPREWF